MKNLTLDINTLDKMHIDEIISLYKQGYRVNEIRSTGIKSLATCTSTIVQGTTKTLTITPSGGTPPYKNVQLLVDGVPVLTLPGPYQASTPIQITYSFPESAGNHTYSSKIEDSCSPASNVAQDASPCTILITSPQPNTYGCVQGVCTPNAGNLPAGCNGTCTNPIGYNCTNCNTPITGGTYPTPTECQVGCGIPQIDPCLTCDKMKNVCILGQCVPKSAVFYAGIAAVAIMLFKK